MEYFNKPLHTYTLNLSSQNGVLLNKYQQRYHIKLYDFPGEKGKFLLPDISTILNLISVLENSHEVPISWGWPGWCVWVGWGSTWVEVEWYFPVDTRIIDITIRYFDTKYTKIVNFWCFQQSCRAIVITYHYNCLLKE